MRIDRSSAPRSAWRRYLRIALAAATTQLLVLPAQAGWFQWDMVELPADSGAACGNGSPYRFFVNRTPLSADMVIVFEGGGACWDQRACEGQGRLAAANPNGIPPNYMQTASTAFGLVTPFNARNSPERVRTQSWNMVFLPYCTGDTHTGSRVTVYDDADPAQPRVQYHRGQANIAAAARWLRDTLGAPGQLLLTGYSAGGVGSTANYAVVRDTLEPTGQVSLLADSGPLMPAPRGGTPETYPSLPLHERIREAWGLDGPDGLVTRFGSRLVGFDPDDLGSVNRALALTFPNDGLAYTVFDLDANFSAFSYEKFYDDIAQAPNQVAYRRALFSRWWPDLARWTGELDGLGNAHYYVPYFRNFNDSHCATIIDFSGTGIESAGVPSLASFVDNLLDRGTPVKLVEPDNRDDFTQPLSPFMRLIKLLDRLF
ncbi:MAG: hypothetical protein HYZ20_18195 [Burkholderiales bacterium]|nr:hypothetical protein [Burkholderiales bacterium]